MHSFLFSSEVEKKEAEPPEVSQPAKIKSEKPTDALPYMKNTVDGLKEDNPVIKDLKDVATKVQEEEFIKSTMLTRLMVLGTKSPPMFTTEPPDPNVTTDAAPPTEVTSEASMETTLTPTAAEKNPAEDKSEEAEEEAADGPMDTFTKPVAEDTPANDTPPPHVATEASPILEPGGHKPALKDIVTTYVVIPEQNRKTTKNNQAAQVQETFSKVAASLTDDDDAFTRAFPFNTDPIRPMSDETKVPNMSETAAGAVNKPKVIEPCANAAQANMTSHEASTMARPETDPPEVAREGTKDEGDPESDNPCSSSRQRFVEPTDKLPMTATAWDKIHVFAGMASNKMVQCVKPFRMRKPDENEKGVYDKFYGSSAENMIGPMTQIHAKDGVAFKSLLFDPDRQPPGHFNKYGQAAEMIKRHIRWIFVTDDFTDIMPSYHNLVKSVTESEDPPLNVSRYKGDQGRQLEALTEREDSDARQDEGVHDDRHQKFTAPNHEITSPIDAAYNSIAVGEQNHRVKACLIKKTVEEAIIIDEAHKGDMSKLYSEADNDNVSSKSTTEVTVMMHNTATLKSAHLLKATVNIDDESEEPPEEHDDHDQAKLFEDMKEDVKKIAPLDALFPKIRVSSDDEYQHTHHRMPAMDESPYQEDVQDETYQEDGSRAKNVMTMALHHPQDRQNQTTRRRSRWSPSPQRGRRA